MKRMVVLCGVLLVATMVSGCSRIETRDVEINPITLQQVPDVEKLPLTVQLVIDEQYKNYAIKHELVSLVPGVSETAAYQVGPHLERYAMDAAATVFRSVHRVDSAAAARGGGDLILVPRVVRSSTNITHPIQVMMVVEWLATAPQGSDVLWLTTVESQTSVPNELFGSGKVRRQAYTNVLSDLYGKTVEALRTAPEIRGLAARK